MNMVHLCSDCRLTSMCHVFPRAINVNYLHLTVYNLHPLTWQSLGPLHSRDDLSAAQPVEGSHEASGGVRQGAVVAGVKGVWLDGLQQRQHRGHELRHALG